MEDSNRNSSTTKQMAMMPLSDVNDLDAVVHALGIEDSDETPAEAVAELHAEIERLRGEITRLEEDLAFARRATGRMLGSPNP